MLRGLVADTREPGWRNSHTPSSSSRLTSMKWWPEPSVPSCRRQFFAYVPGSQPALSAAAYRSVMRAEVWSRVIAVL
jgi:hypothetical protein